MRLTLLTELPPIAYSPGTRQPREGTMPGIFTNAGREWLDEQTAGTEHPANYSDDAVVRISALEAKLAAIDALHPFSHKWRKWCAECYEGYVGCPCATARILHPELDKEYDVPDVTTVPSPTREMRT